MNRRTPGTLVTPLALLAALVLSQGCTSLLPSKSAERLATVQFLAPGEDSECVILRAHGDRIVVLFLDQRPWLDGIQDFLARRGLSRIDDVVFLTRPSQPPTFPSGVTWSRVWGPPEATELLRQAARDARPRLESVAVVASTDVKIPGLELRLIPRMNGSEPIGGLMVDLRHAGNRILLTPRDGFSDDHLRSILASSSVDLLGLVPGDWIGSVSDHPELKNSGFLVHTGAPVVEHPAAILLEQNKRLLFQSAADGLVHLGPAFQLDT